MPANKPIRRTVDIMPLSRDHHHGLLFCWKIKQGLTKKVDLARIQKFVDYFWREQLEGHFKEEEELLFNEVSDKLCDDAILQHRHIEQLIKTVCSDAPLEAEVYASLALAIEKHIRFEERELFPFLELSIDPVKLASIGRVLQSTHLTPPVDKYPDEFWVN